MSAALSRRALFKSGGALVVALGLPGRPLAQNAAARIVTADEVDGFIAVYGDGSVTLYCGKVDLGTGLRAAIPQMAAEELGIGLDRITLVEGDTELTPDQGPTAGSTGIARGGVQIRAAAATARAALIRLASDKFGRPADELVAADGEVRPKAGGKGIGFGALIGNQQFGLKLDPKAPLKDPATYTVVGQPAPRPDVPAKVTGRHRYVHDFAVPGMMHARVVRPPTVGARLKSVDEGSIATIPGAQIVRLKDFLAVAAEDEWDAVCAFRALKASWSDSATLIGHDGVREWMRAGPFVADEKLVNKGDAGAELSGGGRRLAASFYWPVQTHGSMGPSCAVANVRPDGATIWSASQATHRFRQTIAKLLGLEAKTVRVVYLDGAGCYGMNGHDDAAADAALISRALGRTVRVQWMREDEHGWDPKGPPQLLSLEGALTAEGKIAAWRTEQGDGAIAAHPAARPGRGRHRAGPGDHHRANQPERRPALQGAERRGAGALAQGFAAAPVKHPRARQDRQYFRGRELLGRTGRGGRARPARVPPRRAGRPAGRRGAEPRRRADRLAEASVAAAGRRVRSRPRLCPLQAQRDLGRDGDGG
jgi:CO/xanthine dehydrogenase Mo-binding subunit